MSKSQKRALIGCGCVLLVLAAGVAVVAGSGGAARQDGASTTGQRINAGIDNLLATGVRLLEVPSFMLLAMAAVAAFAAVLIVEKWLAGGRRRWARVGLITAGVVVLFGLALAADRRAGRLEKVIAELRTKVNDNRAAAFASAPAIPAPPIVPAPALKAPAAPAPISVASPTVQRVPVVPASAPRQTAATASTTAPATSNPVKRTALLFDADAAKKALAPFGQVTLRPIIFDQATDAVEVHMDNPLIQAYVAIVDLRTPGLTVRFGGSLDQKTMTSAFAKANDCSVAINGEAGDSPMMNSGLGEWHGNYMSEGKTLLKEDSNNRRPFLAFTKDNHVSFTPMATLERAIRPDGYNVAWGRMDALINGELQTGAERDRQPRTAIGLDKDNTTLILLVVDGRQQQYSLGLTRGEVGMVLRAFGATNGMLCDEGGSSIMMFKGWGIVNSPSDGEERATYTHFGISLKPG